MTALQRMSAWRRVDRWAWRHGRMMLADFASRRVHGINV